MDAFYVAQRGKVDTSFQAKPRGRYILPEALGPYLGRSMGLTRKLRKVGDSLIVAVPSQLAGMLGLKAGDWMEWEHLGEGSLRLKKVRE